MRLRLASLAVVSWSLWAGCTSAQGTPTPVTAGLISATPAVEPNVLVLVDFSGSMNLPLDASAADCPAGCGVGADRCPAACATRLSETRAALSSWFDQSPTARLALATYPVDFSCGATSRLDVAWPAAGAQNDLPAMRATLNARLAGGGTPTGTTLTALSTLPELNDPARPRAVVLITDGVPNCNEANPNHACSPSGNAAACHCTVASCQSELCAVGCLDDDGTTAAISALTRQGVETFVIGFGADASLGDAPAVFSRMARAGSAREPRFATDRASLHAALSELTTRFTPDACTFTLARPLTDGETLEVKVNGAAATWQWKGPTTVHVDGPCTGATFRSVE